MLKIRLQGTLKDIQWFRRILEKHKELDILEVSDAYAELITLLFFEEFTVKETAQYFGCCPKTIRNRRKKVLEKLKEQLEKT